MKNSRDIYTVLTISFLVSVISILAGCTASEFHPVKSYSGSRVSGHREAFPGDPDEAVEKWTSMLRKAGNDSIAVDSVRARIRKESFAFAVLAEKGAGAGVMFTAVEGLKLADNPADSAFLASTEAMLIAKYPESREVYDLAAEEFYEKIYPVWKNDSLKTDVIEKLMEKYPGTPWRRTMFRYLIHSLSTLKRIDELKNVLATWRTEWPDDFRPWLTSARVYMTHGLSLKDALFFASKADSLAKADLFRPQYISDQEWNLERNASTLQTGAVLAKALLANGERQRAEKVLLRAISGSRLGVDDETTPAECFYLMGLCRARAGDSESAASWCIKALVSGDILNKVSESADSLFRALMQMEDADGVDLVKRAEALVGYRDVVFTDVTVEYGLGEANGRRVAWADFDGDGYQDLLLDGYKLFRNSGGEGFREVTVEAGLGKARGNGGLWVDFDLDGDPDIVTIDPESQWINDGGVFHLLTGEAYLSDNGVSTEGLGAGDVNGDGFADLYFADYEVWKGTESLPEKDRFFFGEEGGRFTEGTDEVGVTLPEGGQKAGRGVSYGDFDNDGDLDIFVSDYRLTENLLWVNDGSGHFSSGGRQAGVAGTEKNGWWGHTIGSDWGDFDNDGDLDLITANLAHPRYIDFSDMTMLYENQGPPDWTFIDKRRDAGIRYEETHSEPGWCDFDNDGLLDLYINDVYKDRRSFLYMQNDDGTFRDVTWLAGVRRFNGWGCAFADIDRDGDQDILSAGGGGVRLFRNDSGNNGHWLIVEFSPAPGKGSVLGARLTLSAVSDGKSIIRDVCPGKGTTSQNSPAVHFGLGNATGPFTLTIHYPSKHDDTVITIKEVDRYVTIHR